MPDSQDPQVFLSFDFGLRYIGVAVGQAITGSATPLEMVYANWGKPKWEQIDAVVKAWNPNGFVVGLPYQMDGSEQTLSIAARAFAEQLKKRFHLPVYLVDERFTTREAKSQLSSSGIKPKSLPSSHSYAAKLILEAWFSSR